MWETARPLDFFVLLGNASYDAAQDRIRAAGLFYRHKILRSGSDNWVKIMNAASSGNNQGTIAHLTSFDYRMMAGPRNAEAGPLFAAIARRPHVVYVHEAVHFGTTRPRGAAPSSAERAGARPKHGDYWDDTQSDEVFDDVGPSDREAVKRLMSEHGVNVLTYLTNYERAIMADQFVANCDENLLFELYIPAGACTRTRSLGCSTYFTTGSVSLAVGLFVRRRSRPRRAGSCSSSATTTTTGRR